MSRPPMPVSPLIKFARWSLLGLGILYGSFRQKHLSEKETKLRVIEAKKRKIREAKLAEEKKQMRESENLALDILAGKKR